MTAKNQRALNASFYILVNGIVVHGQKLDNELKELKETKQNLDDCKEIFEDGLVMNGFLSMAFQLRDAFENELIEMCTNTLRSVNQQSKLKESNTWLERVTYLNSKFEAHLLRFKKSQKTP